MKKLVIFSVLVIGVLTLPACNLFNTVSDQTETNVLAAFQTKSSPDLVAAATTSKTAKPWDGNYSVSGSVVCTYDMPDIAPTTIQIPATPFTVKNNAIVDETATNKIMVSSKGKATARGSLTDKDGVKTIVKTVYQFTKTKATTKVTGKTTMTITIPAGEQIITSKCSGTLKGEKQN